MNIIFCNSIKKKKDRISTWLGYHDQYKVFLSALFVLLSIQAFGAVEAKKSKQTCCNLPVDVSFLIVDLKYSLEKGAQICEIQHGVPSAFKGNAMLYDGQELIAQQLVNRLDGFYEKSWAAINFFADPTIKKLFLENDHWQKVSKYGDLDNNKEFLINATLPVDDPANLYAYHGFVFMSPLVKVNRLNFQEKYPGVVLVDNAFYGYATNKHKMTELLMGHPLTEQHKPKWGFYKKDDKDLADRINSEIGSDILVIKPTDQYRGEGVIIVKKEELKSVLQYLFDKKNKKVVFEDQAYEFWRNGDSSEFIVEEFIAVEPVSVPHLDGKLYSPTLRLAFLLFYDQHEIDVVCLGGYYTLPKKSVCEEGSLNEKYKSYVKVPYFAKVDPKIKQQAEIEIKEVLKIVYQKLLGIEEN